MRNVVTVDFALWIKRIPVSLHVIIASGRSGVRQPSFISFHSAIWPFVTSYSSLLCPFFFSFLSTHTPPPPPPSKTDPAPSMYSVLLLLLLLLLLFVVIVVAVVVGVDDLSLFTHPAPAFNVFCVVVVV